MGTLLFVSPDSPAPTELSLLNHTVVSTSSVADALAQITDSDLVVIDGGQDLVWSRRTIDTITSSGADVPCLLAVAETGLGLISREWGFEDFIVKGFSAAEVDARIRLILRSAEDSRVLAIGPIRIDESAYLVTISGQRLDLTYTEFELLRYLMQHPGRVLTREVLLNQVWGYDYFGGTRTVDVHIRRLRAKLGQFDSFISTVRNVGYRFASAREADRGH